MNLDEVDVLARTIYGEARGEYMRVEGGIASLIAVANVVMNRLERPMAYGQTITDICHKAWQFSCWNHQDPNYTLLMGKEILDPAFTVCQKVATKVSKGDWPDITKGSNHYHATSLKKVPVWARGQLPRFRISQHIFYKL